MTKWGLLFNIHRAANTFLESHWLKSQQQIWLFINKGFQTIVFIFIDDFHNVSVDMSSGLQVFVELGNLHGTTPSIESTGVACSDSVSHNRVQVLSIPILLLACSQDLICNLQMIVSLEA